MKKVTLKALNGSIHKWENIRDEKGFDEGTANCPLCKRFYNSMCCTFNNEKCPVYERTGAPLCGGTPIDDWDDLDGYGLDAFEPLLKGAAQNEIDFLTSLLPLTPSQLVTDSTGE